jgi:hypothetical protein
MKGLDVKILELIDPTDPLVEHPNVDLHPGSMMLYKKRLFIKCIDDWIGILLSNLIRCQDASDSW